MAIQPIQPYRPGAPSELRAPASLDALEAGIRAARGGDYTVIARGVRGHSPYNAVIRTEGCGDFLAQLEGTTDEPPDAGELLPLARAADVAGLRTCATIT